MYAHWSSIIDKGVFKGGGSGGSNPSPPRNFQIFLKSEGKEMGGGGGVINFD